MYFLIIDIDEKPLILALMKLGQKVKFLNQEGIGTIQEIRRSTAVVKDEYGFLNEIDLDELIAFDPSFDPKIISVPEELIKNEVKQTQVENEVQDEIIVDLHIGHLVDFPAQYSAHEKFQLQLKEAENVITSFRKKTKKLILIHGKGNGKLEQAVYEILEKTPQIKFKEADFKRYKLGAVEILYL